MLLCNRHTPARDIFYRYYTHIAELLPYIICVLILFFGRVGNAAIASTCIACSELTTQIIKHIVVAPRPLTWFETHFPDVTLPIVDGITMNHWFSFPSGHTTSFFSLAFVLCLLFTKLPMKHRITGIFVQTVLFLLAAIGGYSRIYLSQHFAADVLGGMIVGLFISVLCYLLFERWKDQKWFNYRLFTKK